jgi:hypothetical protein
MDVLIRIIKLILLITTLHSKGLERSIGDMSAKKRHYLIFFQGFDPPNESLSFWNVKVILHAFLVYI